MSKLLDVDPASPVKFSNEKDLTGYWNALPIGRTHVRVSHYSQESSD